MYYSSFVAIVLLMAFATSAVANPDEVRSLPGLSEGINFRHYSGYLNASEGKHLHYWFVESQHSPSKDPLILWLNGGPGCSSMAGALTELGPFRIDSDGRTVRINKYSWNRVANILFLEAPAGVGFSYSTSHNYDTDDDITARDNYFALQTFFAKYPQFRRNEFYIAGESYAGIYVPTLSVLIMESQSRINFKGFAIGNGYLDGEKLSNSIIFFAYHHGLIDASWWDVLVKLCCQEGPTRRTCRFNNPSNEQCGQQVEQIVRLVQRSGLNMYNLYANCARSSALRLSREAMDTINLLEQFSFMNHSKITVNPPCVNARPMNLYLNRGEVRSALHIPSAVHKWEICSSIPYRKQYNSMRSYILKLLSSGRLRGLIYNGDVDMACNFLGDDWFVEDLGLPVVQNYRPWIFNGQIAGFVKVYKNLAMLTVKGAGHMVPADKPGEALKMIFSFLFDRPY